MKRAPLLCLGLVLVLVQGAGCRSAVPGSEALETPSIRALREGSGSVDEHARTEAATELIQWGPEAARMALHDSTPAVRAAGAVALREFFVRAFPGSGRIRPPHPEYGASFSAHVYQVRS